MVVLIMVEIKIDLNKNTHTWVSIVVIIRFEQSLHQCRGKQTCVGLLNHRDNNRE